MKRKNVVPNEELNIIKKESRKNKTEINIDASKLNEILMFNKDINELNTDVFSLFPNIKLAIEIMTSSILSPNTMTGEDYNLTLKNKLLPLDIVGSIVNTIKEHVDTHYKFKDKLYDIIEETIYTKGSYCELILPPDLIIDLYNKLNKKQQKLSAGIEDYLHSFDYLSTSSIIDKTKLKRTFKEIEEKESLASLINITENFTYFVRDRVVENMLNSSCNYGVDVGIEDSMVVDSILMLDENIELENDFKLAYTKKIPNDSVIPISDKDDPKKHYGYFVILNSTGTPISTDELNVPTNKHLINFGLANENKKISEGEKLIKKAKKGLESITRKAPDLNNKEQIVQSLLAAKIEATLKNSILKDLVNYDIEFKKEVIDLIYKKLESNEQINIVFVPTKYLMYYAVNYRENGTGKSILEDVLLLASIKAMLFLTRISAYIRGSIVITDIKVELDEDDPEPEKTLAKVLNYVKRSRQMQLPMGMTKVNDLVDWLHNVGFKITASHPSLPRFELEYDENTLPINVPDSELEELIEKYISLTLGVTPEMVDNSYSPDFATTIIANNVLMTRRVYMKQKSLNPLLTEHIKKYIQNDPILYNKIQRLIEENISSIKKKILKLSINDELKKKLKKLNNKTFVAWVFKEVIRNIEVNLPKPELQEDDPNIELLDKLSSKLDTVLDIILSEDMFDSELLGDLADKIGNQKNILKGLIVYKWMSENRVLPEVTSIFSVDEDGKPMFNLADEYKTLVEALKSNIIPLLKEMNKFKKKSDEQLDKLEEDNDSYEDDNENNDSEENSNEEENDNESSETEETTEETEENENNEEDNEEENSESDNEESKEEDTEESNDEDDLTKGLF